jgi:hypothetical protein
MLPSRRHSGEPAGISQKERAKTDAKARRREQRDGWTTGEIRPSSAIHIYLETVVDGADYLCVYSGWRAFESA